MTAADGGVTSAEHVLARVVGRGTGTDRGRGAPGLVRLGAGDHVPALPPALVPPPGGLPTGVPPPRVRLVPAQPPARRLTAAGPAVARPPTLDERVRVVRGVDRSLVLEATDEDRGSPPATDPALVVRRLATASVEVVLGSRPVAQLTRWVAPGMLDALRARAVTPAQARPSRAPTCRGVHVCLVEEHVAEATAVVDDGRRVRAVAVRLETHRGSWRATALEVG